MPVRSTSSTSAFDRIVGALRGAVLGGLVELGLRLGDVRDHVTDRSELWALDAEWFQLPMLGLVLGGLWPALTRSFLHWFDDDDHCHEDRDDRGAGLLGVLMALVLVALIAGAYVLYLHRPAGR